MIKCNRCETLIYESEFIRLCDECLYEDEIRRRLEIQDKGKANERDYTRE